MSRLDRPPFTPPETAPPAPARWVRTLRALFDAGRFVFTEPHPLGPDAPRRASVAVAWVVPLGLLVGLAWAGVFRATWRLYGEIGGLRLVPGLAVALLEAFITGRLLIPAMASASDAIGEQQDRRSAHPASRSLLQTPLTSRGVLVLLACFLTQWALVVSIPVWTPWWPTSDDWRSNFNFLYPRPIYRPLLLAPLWGRWALLMAASLGRTSASADPATVEFCRSVRPGRLLRHAILPLALTCVYCSRERNVLIGLLIGMIVFAVSYLAGVIYARRLGGQSRITLLATAQLAQIAFLATYRALWAAIYL